MSVLSVAVLLLLLLVALAVGTGGADDPSYYWGQLAYRECRAAIKEEKGLPRGLCDAIQEALEQYIEATGYQLAEAMGVSFSRDVAKRLLQMPFRMTGEQGVRSTIAEMIRLRSRDSKEIEKHVGTWASAWLLKASADDKQGQMPPPGANMMEDLQKTLQQTQQAEAKTEADEDDTRKEL